MKVLKYVFPSIEVECPSCGEEFDVDDYGLEFVMVEEQSWTKVK